MALDCVVERIKWIKKNCIHDVRQQITTKHHQLFGYGCRTQMRLENLVADGYHFKLEFGPVLDKQYACAILGVPVPCPTPLEDFVPEHVRQRYEYDWPSLGVTSGSRAEGPYRNHGWKW